MGLIFKFDSAMIATIKKEQVKKIGGGERNMLEAASYFFGTGFAILALVVAIAAMR